MALRRADKKESQKRSIPLERVKEVREGSDMVPTRRLQADEWSATVLFEDDMSLIFCFQDLEDRDTFVACMRMCVQGRKAEVAPSMSAASSASEVSEGSSSIGVPRHAAMSCRAGARPPTGLPASSLAR
mmetsp:Transcript_52556/g.169571  ORF Transcript_52556/g.169571 Transcript_52556/m.169571 type:complete len:129 (-) Transcript_52556:871-1257(-)